MATPFGSSPSAGGLLGKQFAVGPSNDYFHINPLTGQYERVYRTGRSTGEYDNPYIYDFYHESDKPDGAEKQTYQREANSGIEFLTKAGLQTLATIASPILGGAVSNILWSDDPSLSGVAGGAALGYVGGEVGSAVTGYTGSAAAGSAAGSSTTALGREVTDDQEGVNWGNVAGAGAAAGAGTALTGYLDSGATTGTETGASEDFGLTGNEGGSGNILLADSGQTMTDAGLAGTETAGEPEMWDWLDEVSYEDTGSGEDFGLTGNEGGYDPSMDTGAGTDFGLTGNETDTSFLQDILNKIPPEFKDLVINQVKKSGIGWLKNQIGGIFNSAGGSSGGGSNEMGWGDIALNSSPMALSALLAYQQRKDLNPYLNRLDSLDSQLAGNQSAYLKSITDPYDQSTAQQQGALQTSLGNRGVLGSSFGNMDINNLNYMRDLGRGNLLAGATNQAIGTRAGLAGQSMTGVNQRNLATNALLGAGMGASARLFGAKQNTNPFGLDEFSKLLGWSNGMDGI